MLFVFSCPTAAQLLKTLSGKLSCMSRSAVHSYFACSSTRCKIRCFKKPHIQSSVGVGWILLLSLGDADSKGERKTRDVRQESII
jgi:hypothetical protein